MELHNKKIAFLGDSITAGAGTAHPYWRVLESRTGARCYDYGISGTRIARQQKPSTKPAHDRDFGSRVEEMIPDADVIVVFGGTNDFGHGDAPLGRMEDRTEDTFYGALHCLLYKLIERYPARQVVVMTPLHRLSEAEYAFNELGVRRSTDLEGYVNAIIQVAGFYGIPVLDLFHTSGIQPRHPVLRERYMPDGLHPNDAGHARIAERLIGFLQAL